MKTYNAFTVVLMVLFSLSSYTVSAEEKDRSGQSAESPGDIAAVIEDAIVEVVDHTIGKAKDVVRKNTGIDLDRRGYGPGRSHSLPNCASDEARRELNQMQNEYNREIHQLEEELERKLARAEAEFEREAAREDKAEKIYEKREKLEKKVDDAYSVFDEKVAMQNRKYDEKRDRIINRERGSDQCRKSGIDRGRDREEGGFDRGKDRDEQERGRPERAASDARDEQDRGIPEQARERAGESKASDTAREQSAVHSESEEKKWWQFWK